MDKDRLTNSQRNYFLKRLEDKCQGVRRQIDIENDKRIEKYYEDIKTKELKKINISKILDLLESIDLELTVLDKLSKQIEEEDKIIKSKLSNDIDYNSFNKYALTRIQDVKDNIIDFKKKVKDKDLLHIRHYNNPVYKDLIEKRNKVSKIEQEIKDKVMLRENIDFLKELDKLDKI